MGETELNFEFEQITTDKVANGRSRGPVKCPAVLCVCLHSTVSAEKAFNFVLTGPVLQLTLHRNRKKIQASK